MRVRVRRLSQKPKTVGEVNTRLIQACVSAMEQCESQVDGKRLKLIRKVRDSLNRTPTIFENSTKETERLSERSKNTIYDRLDTMNSSASFGDLIKALDQEIDVYATQKLK